MKTKIDIPNNLVADYSASERQDLIDIINNSPPEIARGLEVVKQHTRADGTSSFVIYRDDQIIDFKIALTVDESGAISFFKE